MDPHDPQTEGYWPYDWPGHDPDYDPDRASIDDECAGIFTEREPRSRPLGRSGQHRASDATWARARADYLAGESAAVVCDRYGMRVSTLRTRAAAEPHAAIVMHEILGRLEHQHGVAAGVTVEHKIHRILTVLALHVAWVGELFFHLHQHACRIAVWATGAECRCPINHLHLHCLDLLEQFQLRVDTLGIDGALQLGQFQEKPSQSLDELAGVQSARLGDARQAVGKLFAPDIHRPRRITRVLPRAIENSGHLILEKRTALLNYNQVREAFGKFAHHGRVQRVGNSHFHNGKTQVQPEHRQRMA